MPKTHTGYFLVADITGYTRYLSESELEHAQQTLTALLELLVLHTRPPLLISRLAGDAVISYALQEHFFQSQTFVEKLEATYVAFRQAIERMVRNTTCPCAACANISNLDLKFFVHYGAFGIQHIADHDELVGSDVNLLHRLLKNRVTETTGVRAYALYTDAALRQLGLKPLAEAMAPHREQYDHLGEVEMWVQDMQPVWESRRGSEPVPLPAQEIVTQSSIDIEMPPEVVWDYLIQPAYRNSLIGSDKMLVANRTHGRIAPGSIYQCYHGDKLVPQTILEWTPFESMLVEEISPLSPSVAALCEYRLAETGAGTRLTKVIARPTGPLVRRTLVRFLLPLFGQVAKRQMESFRAEIEADYDARQAGTAHKHDTVMDPGGRA